MRLKIYAILEKLTISDLLILFFYCLAPFLFFGVGLNLFKTVLAPGDAFIQGVPVEIFSTQLSPWNPYLNSGTFAFKDVGSQSLYPISLIIMNLFPNLFGYNLLLLLHYSLAGLFTFLFLKKLGLRPAASFIGGISFMFTGFLSGHKGHHMMVMTAAYLPVILYFFENFITHRKLSHIFAAGMAFGLCLLADYPAASMYIGMVVFPYILFRIFMGQEYHSSNFGQKLTIFVVSVTATFLIGILLAAVELIPVVESFQYITRQKISYEFFVGYSFPLRMLPTLIFPYFFGTHSPNSIYPDLYFGPGNLTEMIGYMGILPVLFAALAVLLFRTKNRQIYFWAGVALVGFVLVLGDSTPVYKLLYHVPIYNLFRVPARNWLEVNFAIAILSGLFVDFVTAINLEKKEYFGAAIWVISLLFFFAFVIFISPEFFARSSQEVKLLSDNTRLSSASIYIPVTLILSASVVLLLLQHYKNRIIYWALVAGLIFADLFSFGHYHDNSYPNYDALDQKTPTAGDYFSSVLKEHNSFRVYPTNISVTDDGLYPNTNLLYDINTINYYGPIQPRNYQLLTTFDAAGQAKAFVNLIGNGKALSNLSTRYLITNVPSEKETIESVMANTENVNELIISGFQDGDWGFLSADQLTTGTVSLQVKDADQVSLIQHLLPIETNTEYIINFKARLLDKDISDESRLIIDLFGQNFDLSDYEIQMPVSQIDESFKEFTISFFIGPQHPANAYLRLFTFSSTAYEIKNVRVLRHKGARYWGLVSPKDRTFPLYQKRFESPNGLTIYENLNFSPRARFVNRVITVPDADSAIFDLWYNNNIDPAKVAFVEEEIGEKKFDLGEIIQADYSRMDQVTVDVTTGEKSFLVLADTWYPGWKATVDGKDTKIYRTNGTLRGILISGGGNHRVVFKFFPMSYYLGLGISCLILINCFLFLSCFGLRFERKLLSY